MDTKERNKNNITALVKLGIDTSDLANTYLNITEKGKDISKEEYIENLTEVLKYFQTRNSDIKEDDNVENAIFKEDVLDMIKKNKNLIKLDINKKIKPVCEKLDSYYFMNSEYKNNVIKKNPKIFNMSNYDLEAYSTFMSNFVVNIDNEIVNLYEYVLKQKSELLQENPQKVFGRFMYIKDSKNSKMITEEELDVIFNNCFCVSDEQLKEKYCLPEYKGESIKEFKQKIIDIIE